MIRYLLVISNLVPFKIVITFKFPSSLCRSNAATNLQMRQCRKARRVPILDFQSQNGLDTRDTATVVTFVRRWHKIPTVTKHRGLRLFFRKTIDEQVPSKVLKRTKNAESLNLDDLFRCSNDCSCYLLKQRASLMKNKESLVRTFSAEIMKKWHQLCNNARQLFETKTFSLREQKIRPHMIKTEN